MIVMSSAGTGLGVLFLVVLIYFAPTLIAGSRGVSSVGSVFVVNLFLGWTLIGWVVALAMAARSVPESHRQAQLEANRQRQELKDQELLAEISQRPRR